MDRRGPAGRDGPAADPRTGDHHGIAHRLQPDEPEAVPAQGPDHVLHRRVLQSEAIRNTQELLNRIAGAAAALDIELAAINMADPGRDV